MSAWLLSRLEEPPVGFAHEEGAPIVGAGVGLQDFRRFCVFSGLMHLSVTIVGPYFVVYLLRELHWSYGDYAWWVAAQVLGQRCLWMPGVGRRMCLAPKPFFGSAACWSL